MAWNNRWMERTVLIIHRYDVLNNGWGSTAMSDEGVSEKFKEVSRDLLGNK